MSKNGSPPWWTPRSTRSSTILTNSRWTEVCTHVDATEYTRVTVVPGPTTKELLVELEKTRSRAAGNADQLGILEAIYEGAELQSLR